MDNVTIVENCNDAAIADWLAARLGEALSASAGPVTITVPGGSTPFPIIEALLAHDLDWTRLVVWPGDDRVVPEDHAASNTGRLRDLFEPAGAEVVTLTEMEAVPPFALAWLGMGTDGHIASLFPNTDPRVDDPRRIVRLTPDPLPPEAPFDRISRTTCSTRSIRIFGASSNSRCASSKKNTRRGFSGSPTSGSSSNSSDSSHSRKVP